MKSYIIDTLIGIFALDENGTIINFIDFDDDEKKIIDFYDALASDSLLEEFNTFLKELKNTGYDDFIFDNRILQTLSLEKLHEKAQLMPDSLEFKAFRLDLLNQLKKVGINISDKDLAKKFKNINETLIKNRVSEASSKGDMVIIQVIETLDTIKKSISLFSSKLREWYGLYFPELTDKIIDDNIVLARIIKDLGERKNFTLEKIEEKFDFPQELQTKLVKKADSSMGANIDLEIIQSYASQILSLDSHREHIENYLDDMMDKTAPNIKAIVGSLVGAKMIAKAGGLKKLAFMPASRVQLLGAEKALYRFLRTGDDRPKHGIIFQWNQIRGSKPWLRGKISRLVAGKLGLMAKVDYFSGEFIGEKVSQEVEAKIKEIEKKYPNPPKKPPKKPKKQPARKPKGKKGGKRRR